MHKVRYEIDPHNRLVEKSAGLRGLRKVLDGRFKVGKKNSLSYHVKSAVPAGAKAPHQVKLKGKWSLNKNHDLCLTLDKWKRQTFGDQLRLQGQIVDVRKNSLLFALRTRKRDRSTSIYALELSGVWKADKHNRLNFRVNKGKDEYDTLNFDGIWQIGKNYQIIYRYKKKDLLRKVKKTHTLAFKGHWDIWDKYRLSYVIDKASGSVFDFKTGLGIFRDKYIKYEVGVGLSRRALLVKRSITFFGKWKIKKSVGLIFEIEEARRKIQQIVFGADARLTKRDTVVFKLKNNLNQGVGSSLELSRDIFNKEGQVFLRLLKSGSEKTILAGSGFRW
ncbi:MAG: hypothetical protein DRP74_01445 [Candidatus Omnitrophota bacterium]|nr:MAG: hypothetical protein DRP74_01445 [Candidatus Omnitrophota bacterium]